MINNIQEHHSDEEIENIRLQNEINLWKSELDFLSLEIDFYLGLFKSSLIEIIKINQADVEKLFNQFQRLKNSNKNIKNKCQVFQPKLEEKNECEDVQCDHAYLNMHLSLRTKIEMHLREARNAKHSAFIHLKNGMNDLLN